MIIFDGDDDILMKAAGTKDGEVTSGFTTKGAICEVFGDLANFVKDKLTQTEFDSIIQRCEEKGWGGWEISWQDWSERGLV